MQLRVGMNVINQLCKIGFITNLRSFEWRLKQRADAFMLFVERHCIRLEKLLKLMADDVMGRQI